jgi:hypothetical protein
MITINVYLSGAEGQHLSAEQPTASVELSPEDSTTLATSLTPTLGQPKAVNAGPPAVSLLNETADFGFESFSESADVSFSAAPVSGGSAPNEQASQREVPAPENQSAMEVEVINAGPPKSQPTSLLSSPMED